MMVGKESVDPPTAAEGGVEFFELANSLVFSARSEIIQDIKFGGAERQIFLEELPDKSKVKYRCAQ